MAVPIYRGREVTGFAQTRGEIHETRAHDEAGSVQRAAGAEALRRDADRRDPAGGDKHVLFGVDTAGGIDQPAIFYVNLHVRHC